MRALVRRPGPRLADGLVTHIERIPVDVLTAAKQWAGYVQAFADAGWAVIEVDPAPKMADSVFVEDTVVVCGDLAVITRPGAEQRQPEVAGTERVVAALGYQIARIAAPGTLDGGDVLKVATGAGASNVYVGQGGRTNAEGSRQLAEYLAPLGATVVAVPVTKALHLKSTVTALPDGTIIGWAPVVDDPTMFPSFLAVPEQSGAHVVLLGDGKLLMSARAPETAELLARMGYQPVPVDIAEFEKLEGCVTCLSVRLR